MRCNVMVSYHGHEWVVAKNDVSEGEIHLLERYSNIDESYPFYMSEIEAFNDFDMKFYTDCLRNFGLNFKLDDNSYIPTVGQLAAMYLYRKELNKALKMVHGTPMKEGDYCSPNWYKPRCSWSVNFSTGYVRALECNIYHIRSCKVF